MIVPDLQPLAVPVDSLRTLEGNARRGDVEAVMRSLDKFGQRKPIVVRADTHEVIAGNHTFMAARRLGWSEIAVVWVEDDETTAKAFALADNRTSELGTYDTDLLAAMIADVKAADADLLAAASYTDADLSELLQGSLSGVEEPETELPVPEVRQAPVKLLDRFMGIPVTVFNSREGWWQDRKRAWTGLGIESELGREDKPRTWNLAAPPGSGHQVVDLVRHEAGAGDEDDYGAGATSIFDPVLCEMTYRWFCPPGGLILDPFAGGSVRGVVASKLGRRYVGLDVRQVQVDANRVQADRICSDGLAVVPEVPEDFMPDVTPIEEHGDIWMKREDLYAFAGVRGAKVRTCMFLVQQALDAGVGVVTAGARQSPQVNFVAQIASRMGVKCRCHVPSGSMTPELVAAKAAGAELVQHEAGYNTVIVARAREDAVQRGWVEIPYGMESPEAVTFTKPQVRDFPVGVKRIVNAVGSGMTLAGILWGLVDAGLDIPVVGVCVGHPPVDRLDRHAPPNWRDMVTIVDHPSEYHDEAKVTVYDGVQLDPWYEAKCIDTLEPGDLLWVSAIRPSVVPAVAPMPVWMTGDSTRFEELDPLKGEKADLWFSCPPYGDLEVYSDDPADLSTMSAEEFLAGYRKVILESCEALADDRFAVIVVGDYRDKKGFYRNFVGETVRAFEDAGLRLYNEAVLVTNLASLVLRVGKQFEHSRKLGKSHQNVLTFVKGDPRRATLACGTIQTGDLTEQDTPEP